MEDRKTQFFYAQGSVSLAGGVPGMRIWLYTISDRGREGASKTTWNDGTVNFNNLMDLRPGTKPG